MQLKNNTILITGGSSGIGLELCKRLISYNNTVIICGRSAEKLEKVKSLLPNVIAFQCDLSQESECEALIGWVKENHPQLNVLINNAAVTHDSNFAETPQIDKLAVLEVNINLLAPIRLINGFLATMQGNPSPTIINVTSGLVYCPRAIYPFYSGTKAALHSFTQVLRIQLKNTNIKVIEALFPAVDTPWHKGNPPKIAIPVRRAVDEMLAGMIKNKDEIKIGAVKFLYMLSRISPGLALKKLNNLS